MTQDQLAQILPLVQKPARYIGNELNSIHKDWDKAAIKVALAYPDLYEIGMSNLGIQILYHILNQPEDVLCERVFAPWPDMEGQLTTNDLRLTTLESQKPLNQCDLLGISLGHELTYTNIITMLKLGGIPVHAKDRTDKDPLVMGGGPCAYSPEPVADFFDFFVIGEAEEVIVEIVDCLRKLKAVPAGRQVESRKLKVRELAKIPGIYVPGHSDKATKRLIRDLSSVPYPLSPIVPFIETVHDRAVIEIMRGCPWGCKFCQAGWTSRPVRHRDKETICNYADAILKNTGYEELSLVSLSSSDHPQIAEIAKTLACKYEKARINISLPSMRTNTFTLQLAKEITRVRPSGVTLAPEAGTQRLRDVIGKNMTEEHILEGVRSAFAEGASSIKLYFMLGLPTETEEDLLGICRLSKEILALGKSFSKRINISVNLATFIPKPHTPFEREQQISIAETLQKQQFIKDNLKVRGIEVRWHGAEASFLEGVFARGDKQLSKVIEKAWDLGARFDAWSEQFKVDLWQKAFADCGIDPNQYLRERDKNQPLPWDYINTGVPKV
ncbi:MAG: radical SAM protein [Candidatus Margulisbacteria bacterium]|nr:radical SAM protein [Candidatus Margulisiibacteriota bacterium]